MYSYYMTDHTGKLTKLDQMEKGCWIHLSHPTIDEATEIAAKIGVDSGKLIDALDEQERSRIEKNDNSFLLLVNIPLLNGEEQSVPSFVTIPLEMILTEDTIVTVCLQDNPIIYDFIHGIIQNVDTRHHTRFILQLLYAISNYYLKYLQLINAHTNNIETKLMKSMKNEELFSLLSLEKSLVYMTTSLKSNDVVMEKLFRANLLNTDQEDDQLMENVLIENRQAIEMADIYNNILSGMMDAFASIISNNLNIVMKLLTSLTIILTVPTLIASFYGMNVALPMQHSEHAFMLIIILSLAVGLLTTLIFIKKKFL